jgi:diguanylate cyclase (GGDEF)-like protein
MIGRRLGSRSLPWQSEGPLQARWNAQVLGFAVDPPSVRPGASWLCPTANHRERFLDMQQRLRTARIVTLTTLSATAGVVGATGGWWMLAAAIVAVLASAIGGARLDRRRRPELWIFVSTILVLQLVLAFGAAVNGGPRSLAPNLLAIPVLMVAARFSNRGLVVGAPVSAALVIAVTLGVDPAYVFAHPESLMVPLALVICTAVYVSPLVASDVRHRADSTLDQLTGLLNRRALEPRFAEISEQAALTSQPVSVVLADLDQFKSINDEHGHGVGDAVLRDVAYAMRRTLRTFELLYRLGGEEFALLLPGAAEDVAARIAEALRVAIEELETAGLRVTCSFGVATARGDRIELESLVAHADAALYAAKRGGRNRVERHGGAALAPA